MRLIALILCLIATQAIAQTKAITSNGDEVVLYDDGTWKYVSKQAEATSEIPVNTKEFKKPSASSFQVKSTRLAVGISINPKKWSFKKADNNEDAEFEFQLKDKDAYAMLISEKIEIPIENFKSIAVENAKSVAPDIHIVKQEYRTVNGLKVLMMQLDGTIQGVKFSYYGYYYSFPGGTLQLLTYTSQNLLEEYKPELEELLNGLELVK